MKPKIDSSIIFSLICGVTGVILLITEYFLLGKVSDARYLDITSFLMIGMFLLTSVGIVLSLTSRATGLIRKIAVVLNIVVLVSPAIGMFLIIILWGIAEM